jgi:hypothetical protein
MNNKRSLAKEITEGFEALKSMRNNEPVAFMHKTISSWVSTFIYPETKPDEWLPLYTHPVKELTDDEIEPLISNLPESPNNDELYEFAYAVLRKAKE